MRLGSSPKTFLARALKEARQGYDEALTPEGREYYRGLAVGVIRGAVCMGGLHGDDIERLHNWVQGWPEPPPRSLLAQTPSLIWFPMR